MSSGNPTVNNESLHRRLFPFQVRAIGLNAGRLAILACLCALLVGLFLLWLDTVWALSAEARWSITRPGAALFATLAFGVIAWQLTRFSRSRIVELIDRQQRTGGEVVAGWQLATRPVHPAGELSRSLAVLAVGRATEKLASIPPNRVFELKLAQPAVTALGGTLLALGIVYMLIPDVARHQWNRFLFPERDIPPYTGVLLELELEQQRVLYGQDVLAVAISDNPRLPRVSLIARGDDGQETSIPMLDQGQGRWQAMLTRVHEPIDLYARSGKSRSRMHRLEVITTPRIESATVTVSPPEYTGRGVYRGELPKQGLVGLAGTQVQWQVRSNRPLSTGRLLLSFDDGSSQQIPLETASVGQVEGRDAQGSGGTHGGQPADSEPANDELMDRGALGQGRVTDDTEHFVVTGRMRLDKPGRFELSVVDIEGVESTETLDGRIKIVSDTRPVVRIVTPRPMSMATPDIELPVEVVAEDDFGLSSVRLFRSLNGSPSTSVAAQLDGGAAHAETWTLSLHRYQLQPGDEIQLFARAEDNDPAGAKGSESPVTTVKIISTQRFQEMMVRRQGAESMRAKYQTARRHLEQLAEALRELQQADQALADNNDSQGTAEERREQLRERLEAARQRAEQAAEAIAELSQQPLPIDVDRQLSERLEKMSRQTAEMAEALEQLQRAEQGSAAGDPSQTTAADQERAQHIEQMLAELAERRQQLTEQAIEPMERLQQILPLVIDQQRFVRLTAQQRDLAERLRSLNVSPDDSSVSESRIAELEAEQQALRQELDNLLDDIEQHAAELPDEPDLDKLRETAQDFVDAVRDSQARDEMSATQQSLLAEAFSEGQQHAETAAEILESFLSQCNSMGGQACENCEAAFNPSAGGPNLGDSIEQMLAMLGMKPGATPGGKPGMGFGWGAGGGFSQRFPGEENVGMYGSLPMPQGDPRQGSGGESSAGTVRRGDGPSAPGGSAPGDPIVRGNAGGQSLDKIPDQYRSQVAEYYRTLTERLGSDP